MADENNIEVKFGATTDGLESGARVASGAVAAATVEMKSAFASLTDTVVASQATISGAMDGISAGFGKFNVMVMGLTAALAGGGAIKEFVKDAVKLTAESVSMGKAMGISATEASYLKAALADVGLSTETALTAANKITLALVKNEGAFKNLGVATRDSNGNFLSTGAVMEATNAKLREFGEGTDRNVEGMKIYGRAWSDVAPIVNKFKGVTEEARAEAVALNLVVGQESVDAMAAYKKANNGVGEVLEGLGNTIGQALMPLLTDLAEWFRSIGPTAIEMTRIAVGAVAAAFNLLDVTVYGVWEVVKSVIQTITIGLVTVATTIDRLMNRDWAGAKAAWKTGGEMIAEDWGENMKKVGEKADDTYKRITQLFTGKQTESKAPKEGLHSEGSDKPKADKSELPELKAKLQAKLEANGEYFKDATADELKYWEAVKAAGNLSANDARAVNSLIFNLTKKRLTDEHAEQMTAADQEKALGKERFALKIEEITALLAAGKISEVEALNATRAIHQQEYAMERDLLEQKIALYGTDLAAKAKMLGELETLAAKNNVTLAKDQNATAVAVQKSWKDAFAPISTSFDTAVKGIISGTTSVGKALANMAKGIVLEYANMGVKMALNWAAQEAAKTLATATGATTRTGIEGAAATTSVAISAGAAIKNIMNSAWESMAGAFKAMVGIPYVGPALAVAAGAAAFGVVSGVAGSISSARGGYDIPSGVNPITQLHENEMVLPEKQANAVRQMADGGGGGGGDVHLHVHATDAQSVARLFRDNGQHIVTALQKQRRNFAF